MIELIPILENITGKKANPDLNLSQLAVCSNLIESNFSYLNGETEKDGLSIFDYCMKAKKLSMDLTSDRENTLNQLNSQLIQLTFLVTEHLTLADLYYWSALYKTIETSLDETRLTYCHVTRYFDLVQNILFHDIGYGKELPIRFIDIYTYAPLIELVIEPKKEKENKGEKESVKEIKQDTKTPVEESKESKKIKREKGDKKEKVEKLKEVKIDVLPVNHPARIDLRVGKVLKVEKHPQADSLYVEEIDVGEENPRTVVSGLVKHIKQEDFVGRFVVLVCNLKPAKMRGVESAAMVMCANDGVLVELVAPPTNSEPGDLVYFEGYKGTPDIQLKSKEKVWETIQPKFTTLESKECVFVDDNGASCLMKTDKGICMVPTIVRGQIK